MNNLISVSGGNDSMAMLLVIEQLKKQDPEFFKGDTWTVIYLNTGWARDGWGKRIEIVKSLCKQSNFKFVELTASALNKTKTENDELFDELPDSDHFGMVAHIKKKAFFPNVKIKYCTEELKIKPMRHFLKTNKYNSKNSRQWIGVRREEGGRLGGALGGNKKDRAFTVSLGERDGMDSVHPLAYMLEVDRDKLLKKHNIEVYPTRSEECYPCIYQMKVSQIADIDPSRIVVINNLETKVTAVRHAKYALMGVNRRKDEFFGMFNSKKLGGNDGIVKQVAYAKKRMEFLETLPKDGYGLFPDEVVIDDKCSSGYCGT